MMDLLKDPSTPKIIAGASLRKLKKLMTYCPICIGTLTTYEQKEVREFWRDVWRCETCHGQWERIMGLDYVAWRPDAL